MSMISGLIDELNKSADEWNSSNMFELARMCREAADTIWELRDDLQRANADNAKLRELVRDMYGTYDQLDLCRLCSDVEACDFGLLGDRCSMRDRYLQRMSELGVEVTS